MQNPIPAVLLQPSKWVPLYEDFVTKNASSVGQVESALRSLTYIIPGWSIPTHSNIIRHIRVLIVYSRAISRLGNTFRMWYVRFGSVIVIVTCLMLLNSAFWGAASIAVP